MAHVRFGNETHTHVMNMVEVKHQNGQEEREQKK